MSSSVGLINFDIVGDTAGVQAMLNHLDTAISPTGLMFFLTGTVGPWIRERAKDRFESEGDDVVGKWAPLAPATQEIRSRGEWPVGPTGPINKRTGELEAYVTGSDALVTGHSLGATLTFPGKRTSKRSIKTKMETAQKGRAKPRTPARPVLGLNEKDLSYVITMLAFHVQGGRVAP